MKHFGDITKLHGEDLPLVDIVTGGSPCQDLSVAGKRAGLDGERSGLFMEQIRIIKEMRENDRRCKAVRGTVVSLRDVRPRYMLWENVTGCFSSNGGEDFRIVLEETARVSDPCADVPRPPDGQGWSNVGVILGDGWSLAWSVHSAEHWGVPQRRKRVALVADFGGQSAPEILFERESLSWDLNKSQEERTETSSDFGGNSKKAGEFVECYGLDKASFNQGKNAKYNFSIQKDLAHPLIANGIGAVFSLDNNPSDGRLKIINNNVTQTLKERMGTGGNNTPMILNAKNINAFVRRITPLECERLQGFPDGWTNIGSWIDSEGKKHKLTDRVRYKALGNSIALPYWQWVADRMVSHIEHEHPTMGSLFDGIGGFPLVYQRAGCEPVWASEIEEFPIAVTKLRFKED